MTASPRWTPLLVAWALCVLVLSGCVTSSPAVQAWEGAVRDTGAACEAPESDRCVVLACEGEQEECGVFRCEDVEPAPVAQAPLLHGAQLAQRGPYFRPPFRTPGPSRNWRNTGLRPGARPLMSFHFRYRQGYLPAFPRLQGKLVKHHLFPQEEDVASWLKWQGINIHQYTMVIPEHVHLRVHRGQRGGPWNQAWRDFMHANETRRVPTDELLRKAFELSFRFDIVGPIIPYGHNLVPPEPGIFNP